MLAIKYRPSKFSEVLGQDIAKNALISVSKSKLPVRSILLVGDYGCGKTTLSRLYARSLFCKDFEKTGDVCDGSCPSCREVLSGRSSKYQEFDSTKVGNIESIRGLLESLSFAPSSGRRVIVLDEVHTASTAAQSALLKALEEGVPGTTFVFATTGDVLPTIRSRSLTLELTTLPFSLIEERVKFVCEKEGIDIDSQSISNIALKSGGHVRDALSILDLFTLYGKDAVSTSYGAFCVYIRDCLKKQDIEDSLSKLLQRPILDIRRTISVFINNCLQGKGEFEKKLHDRNLGFTFFQYFYRPDVQQALYDELGMEIVLRAFAEMFKK